MEKEVIRELMYESWEYIPSLEMVSRDSEFEAAGNYVLVGPRQSGKSYLLYQEMRRRMSSGVSKESMVYMNFDDERLRGMRAQDLDLILQAYGTIREGRPVCFFDEIQNVEGWANFARRLANQKYRVYITGSNAKMLSREMQTVLGGRYLTKTVYPYSFTEFLRAKGVSVGQGWQYGAKRNEIARHMGEYFRWGGYPESLLYADKRNWLGSLFTRIYFNDMVVRYKIKNENALRMVVHKLAGSVRQAISYNRIANIVRSTGITCSISAVMDYISYLDEAFVVFSLRNHTSKFTERETSKKYYFVDNGLLGLFVGNDLSALHENLCAITLRRRYGDELYYYKKNIEVDFYVPSAGLAIQACYRMSDNVTLRREAEALARLHGAYPLREAIIVTYEDEDELTIGNLDIKVMPLWKWAILCERG